MPFTEFATEVYSCMEFNPLSSESSQNGVISLCSYKTRVVRAALVEIKDRPNKKLAGLLGELLYEALAKEAAADPGGKILLIPVPMSRKKRRERGWNQCELMLEGFRAAAGRADDNRFEICFDLLAKIRENEDQVGKSRSERFKNLKNCFGVQDSAAIAALRGKDIIIFDDICTTGATLAEARRAVQAAQPKSVTCVSIAR